ncbi:uncharacterized protein ACIBXB_014965 isoform 1-T2 [Morphnus guianensis]
MSAEAGMKEASRCGETVAPVTKRQEKDHDTDSFGIPPCPAFTSALGRLLFLSEKPLHGKGPLQPAPEYFSRLSLVILMLDNIPMPPDVPNVERTSCICHALLEGIKPPKSSRNGLFS